MLDYSKCSQQQLICFIKEDKNSPALDAMIEKYRKYIYSLLKRFNVNGNEQQEFYSDACIGLYSAALHYDVSKNVPFEPYAKICIKRALLNSIKKYYRARNVKFTDCLYIDDLTENLSYRAFELFYEYMDPQSEFIRKEELSEFYKKAGSILTPFEWKVFVLYIDDLSYSQIAEKLDHNIKSISNAVYRIRNKLSVINF